MARPVESIHNVSSETTSVKQEFCLVETILWEPCCGFWLLPEHQHRLRQSAEYFNWKIDEDRLQQQLDLTVQDLNYRPHLIRVSIDRHGEIVLATEIARPDNAPVRAALARQSIDPHNIFLYHSTSNRQIYDDALPVVPEVDEILLWNEKGELTESCTSNLVVKKNDQYYTPPVTCGLLPGTYRSSLIQQGELSERTLTIEQLSDYTEIYLINSRVGWRQVNLVVT
jgi:para-aminobenzoate synthetase/4-amino-4-deoxychorismate lyase